jgi:predicted GNAT superfamily acetyltransferase
LTNIAIKPLHTAEEMAPCEAVQVAAWNMPDPAESVPVHQLLTAVKYGGLVLGAFDGEQMVGLSYSFVGLYQGEPLWCSHMLAVVPACRGRGLAAQLKLEQRRLALEQGIRTIHWTYDPLELVNGTLNIRRLGGIARTYVRELYGSMRDGLNAGLPSDRLVVEWHLDSERVRQAVATGRSAPGAGERQEIAVPEHFQVLRRTDAAAALRVRLQTRAQFEAAFAAGFTLTGVESNRYILTREEGAAHAD